LFYGTKTGDVWERGRWENQSKERWDAKQKGKESDRKREGGPLKMGFRCMEVTCKTTSPIAEGKKRSSK